MAAVPITMAFVGVMVRTSDVAMVGLVPAGVDMKLLRCIPYILLFGCNSTTSQIVDAGSQSAAPTIDFSPINGQYSITMTANNGGCESVGKVHNKTITIDHNNIVDSEDNIIAPFTGQCMLVGTDSTVEIFNPKDTTQSYLIPADAENLRIAYSKGYITKGNMFTVSWEQNCEFTSPIIKEWDEFVPLGSSLPNSCLTASSAHPIEEVNGVVKWHCRVGGYTTKYSNKINVVVDNGTPQKFYGLSTIKSSICQEKYDIVGIHIK